MPTRLVSEIIVSSDRRDLDEPHAQKVAESIRTLVNIDPIVIDEDNLLIDGRHRLRAHEILGRSEIEVRVLTGLSDWQKQVIQFEANYRRKQLTPAEEAVELAKIHEAYVTHKGKKEILSGSGVGKHNVWKMQDTASLLGIAVGTVHYQLKLAEEIRKDPELKKCKTLVQLRNTVARKDDIRYRQVLAIVNAAAANPTSTEDLENIKTYKSKSGRTDIICADSREYIPTLQDASINALITDPPWQTKADSEFGTDPKTGLQLTEEVLKLLYPKLQSGALCVMFCATRHLIKGTIYRLITNSGYIMLNSLFIWCRPKQAKSSNPYREFKEDYEPAVLFTKGVSRQFTRPTFSVEICNLDPNKLHKAQKPVPVLAKLVEAISVKNETIIDPFCGAGKLGCVIEKLNRKGILIDNKQEHFNLTISNTEDLLNEEKKLGEFETDNTLLNFTTA